MVRAKARGLDADRVLDLGIYIIISALVGAKLLLLVTDFRTFTRQPARAADARALRRRVLRRPDPRGRRRALVHPPASACRSGRPATCSRRASRSATSSAGFGCLFAGCCYGKPTTLPWGDHVHRSVRGGQRRHAARRAAAPDAALRSGRRAADPGAAARDRAQGPAVSPAGRSGSTCCSTRSRASSSSSTAATSAARSACSRRRSSSRSSSRRWPSSCWCICSRRHAAAGAASGARERAA